MAKTYYGKFVCDSLSKNVAVWKRVKFLPLKSILQTTYFRTIPPSVLYGIVTWGSFSQSFLSQQRFDAAIASCTKNCKTHFTTSLRIQPSLLAVIHYCNFGYIVIIPSAPSLIKLLKTKNRTCILIELAFWPTLSTTHALLVIN